MKVFLSQLIGVFEKDHINNNQEDEDEIEMIHDNPSIDVQNIKKYNNNKYFVITNSIIIIISIFNF
jgi:hypothetical protein